MERGGQTVGPDESLDHLAGDWRIFQLRRGHRYSTDDLLTAWTATGARPDAERLLDLGAGVGSIGLLTLLQMGAEARLVTLERQEISVALQRKTAVYNDLVDRVDVRCADVRESTALVERGAFDLVTANPPYLPKSRATPSPHPQRAAARLELHGDVFDFCNAAKAALAEEGRFCFSHAAADPRPEQAVEQAGLRVIARRDVIFRAGREPMIALFTCGHTGQRDDPEPLTIRAQDGQWTTTYMDVRRAMQLEA